MDRLRTVPTSWLAAPLILLFFFLALDSMVQDSPTMDEQNHLARGLAFLRTGDPRFSLEHPPLINSLSALPLLLLPDVHLPTDDPSWEQPEGWYRFAELLLWEYNADVTRMIFLARLPIVFLTIFMSLVGYRFAQALWHSPAGLLALFGLLFDPNILAHARYTTTDVGGTTFLLLAIYLLWRLWSRSGWQPTGILIAGIALGLAFGSKLSTLTFVPILGLLALLPLYPGRWRAGRAGQRAAQYVLAGLLSIVVVWLIFGFQWSEFRFKSELLTALNAYSGPMPTYWAGIEQIAGLSSGGRGAAFLLGEFSTTGFLAYFPIAFLAKTPVAALLLLVLAVALLLWRPASRKRALFLFVPAALYFLLSMQSSLNIGYRHLLPALVLLYILISGLASVVVASWRRIASGNQLGDRAPRLLPLTILFCLIGLILATLSIHPHYLSFFNLPAGGPANGFRVLIDSNVDWGQDLLRLQEWMADNDVEHVKLSWFGTADPTYYGIDYEPLPGLPRHFDLWWDLPFDPVDPAPGVYAISVSNLWEIPLQDEKYAFPWFRVHAPDDRVGYSILIYRIPEG